MVLELALQGQVWELAEAVPCSKHLVCEHVHRRVYLELEEAAVQVQRPATSDWILHEQVVMDGPATGLSPHAQVLVDVKSLVLLDLDQLY